MWYGDKIILAPVQREYLPHYVEWLNDWNVSQFLAPGIPFMMTIEDETAWFEAHRNDKNSLVFAILTQPENTLIGNCGLHNLDWKNRGCVFGIFIGDKNYWSQGYGSDAARTMMQFAFGQLGMNRVELEVYAFNPRAIRAYEKAGFKRDGIRRQALYRDGKFHDVHLMSVLREDWDTAVQARSAK